MLKRVQHKKNKTMNVTAKNMMMNRIMMHIMCCCMRIPCYQKLNT
jgi:hypothetical protein